MREILSLMNLGLVLSRESMLTGNKESSKEVKRWETTSHHGLKALFGVKNERGADQ